MERVIVENADLLVEGGFPEPFLKMCAHVSSYKVIVKQWYDDDFSQHNSPVDYPWKEFRQHVQDTFSRLK
jgi:hypothetical protein